ncbi:MAG TPA: PKD domain-containing protein, partial [bacterium]|nr:PKD domain-containing protein [bacterium]
MDGQELLGYTATEVQRNFTTYQMVRVTVEDPACLDPDAVPEADRSEARSGEDITFTSANSTAPGSTLVEYAWDFDGVDPPEYVSATPDPVTYAFINETDRDIIGVASLKVTNACGTFNIDTVELTIHPNQPPVACAEADPDPAASDQTITLDASCSNDPDGDELTIEWDFNWDGNPGNFDVDATGITAQTSYCNTTNGTITANAAVRVTSNDASDIAPVDIAINGNRAPAAVIDATPNPVQSGVQVNFSSAGSADPDTDCGGDSISAYEWDFDYVAPQFDVEATGPSASTTYTNTGTVDITRTAALRVRDTRGGVSPVATEVVTIQPAPPCTRPTARGGVSTTTQVSGLPIEFFANLSTPNAGTFTRYSWDWDVFDAEPPQEFPAVAGNLPNQSHTYLWAGPG